MGSLSKITSAIRRTLMARFLIGLTIIATCLAYTYLFRNNLLEQQINRTSLLASAAQYESQTTGILITVQQLSKENNSFSFQSKLMQLEDQLNQFHKTIQILSGHSTAKNQSQGIKHRPWKLFNQDSGLANASSRFTQLTSDVIILKRNADIPRTYDRLYELATGKIHIAAHKYRTGLKAMISESMAHIRLFEIATATGLAFILFVEFMFLYAPTVQKVDRTLRVLFERHKHTVRQKSIIPTHANHYALMIDKPLRGIATHLAVMNTDNLNQITRYHLQRALELCDTAVDIKEKMQDQAALDVGQFTPYLSSVNFKQLIQEAINQVTPLAKIRRTTIKKHFPVAKLWLKTDYNRLLRITVAVLKRSIDRTLTGQIFMTIKSEEIAEDRCKIRVIFTDKILEPGLEFDMNNDKIPEALALSPVNQNFDREMVGKILEYLGGGFSCEQDIGSNWWAMAQFEAILAPPATLSNLNNDQATNLRQSNEQLNCLVVESHLGTQRMLKTALDQFKANTNLASDGETALIQSQNKNYDLMVFDLSLPDIEGQIVLDKIRKHLGKKTPPIIALSGSIDDHRTLYNFENFHSIIEKPLNKKRLIQVLAKFQSENFPKNSMCSPKNGARTNNSKQQHVI